MGTRGPLPRQSSGRQIALRRRDGDVSVVLPSLAGLSGVREAPKPPAGLKAAGKVAWAVAWEDAPWVADTDLLLVRRLAEVVDEIVIFRKSVMTLGPLLEEPIVSPRGDVVGQRWVANPVVKMLSDSGKELDTISAALGLSVASRTRLQLASARTRVTINKLKENS